MLIDNKSDVNVVGVAAAATAVLFHTKPILIFSSVTVIYVDNDRFVSAVVTYAEFPHLPHYLQLVADFIVAHRSIETICSDFWHCIDMINLHYTKVSPDSMNLVKCQSIAANRKSMS